MDPALWIERVGRTRGTPVDEVFPSLEDRSAFTIAEVARVFGVTVQAVHRWLHTGKLRRVTRMSERGQYQIPRQEFVRLLRESGRSVPGLWQDPQTRETKVLFIDDNAQLRRLVEEIARSPRMSFTVKTAPNFEDGIILAAQCLPDVVFLDTFFGKGRLDGDEALAFIRRAKAIQKVKVVAVSSDSEIGRKMMAAGADGFLRKPFGVTEFRASLLEQTAAARRR
ncbi:MAG: response regulator [Planctomycetota bacterium]